MRVRARVVQLEARRPGTTPRRVSPRKRKLGKLLAQAKPDETRAVSEAADNPPSNMDVLKSQMSALTKMVNESTVPDMKRAYDAEVAHANMAADNDGLDSEECEASKEGEVTDKLEKAKSTHSSCSNDGKQPRYSIGIDKLFDEVNKNIPTSAAINQKMADIVNKIASERLDSDMKKLLVDKYAETEKGISCKVTNNFQI